MTGPPVSISDDELLAFGGDELEPTRAAAVAARVAASAEAAATVGRYRLARAVVRADAAEGPSAAAVARAKGIMPKRSPVADLLSTLRRVVAEVTFDNRAGGAAALAGFRGGMSAYQVAFAGGGAEVDLQLDPPAEAEQRWRLLGQVTTDDDAPATILLTMAAGGERPVAETTADEHGMFGLAALPGRYDLLVRVHEMLIVLPDLEIG